jgi:CBS domain-containing protein
MTTRVVTVEPDATVDEIAKRLLENRISAVPVVDAGGRMVGVVGEGDLMRRTETETERHRSWWLSLLALPEEVATAYVKDHGRHARDVMTREVVAVDEDASLEEIAELLERHRIKRVPVIHDGKLVGIVSRANLLHGLVACSTGASPSIDDWKLKASVEESLSKAGVRMELLNVVVSGGVVHLWGVVATPEEQAAVRVAAESVAGVREVRESVEALPPYMRPFIRAG